MAPKVRKVKALVPMTSPSGPGWLSTGVRVHDTGKNASSMLYSNPKWPNAVWVKKVNDNNGEKKVKYVRYEQKGGETDAEYCENELRNNKNCPSDRCERRQVPITINGENGVIEKDLNNIFIQQKYICLPKNLFYRNSELRSHELLKSTAVSMDMLMHFRAACETILGTTHEEKYAISNYLRRILPCIVSMTAGDLKGQKFTHNFDEKEHLISYHLLGYTMLNVENPIIPKEFIQFDETIKTNCEIIKDSIGTIISTISLREGMELICKTLPNKLLQKYQIAVNNVQVGGWSPYSVVSSGLPTIGYYSITRMQLNKVKEICIKLTPEIKEEIDKYPTKIANVDYTWRVLRQGDELNSSIHKQIDNLNNVKFFTGTSFEVAKTFREIGMYGVFEFKFNHYGANVNGTMVHPCDLKLLLDRIVDYVSIPLENETFIKDNSILQNYKNDITYIVKSYIDLNETDFEVSERLRPYDRDDIDSYNDDFYHLGYSGYYNTTKSLKVEQSKLDDDYTRKNTEERKRRDEESIEKRRKEYNKRKGIKDDK